MLIPAYGKIVCIPGVLTPGPAFCGVAMNDSPLDIYQSILDHAPFGIAVVDGRGAVISANASFAAILPHSNGSKPASIADCLPAPTVASWAGLADTESAQWEGRVEVGGRVSALRVAISALNHGSIRLVSVFELPPIHDCERTADAVETRGDIAEIQEYYRTILDTSPDGVFVTDSGGVVRFWNQRMEEQFGVPASAIVGRCLFDELDYWQSHSAAFQRVLDTLEPVAIDRLHRVNHRGADVVNFITFQPLWRNGKQDGVLGRVSDVTEQAALERQLIKSERMAAVGELAAGVAHNFNNILAGIGGDAQLLRMIAEEDHLGEQVINSADMIYRETMRGGRIAHDLLSFARGQEPCLSEVDIAPLISEAVRLTKTYPQASTVDVRPQVPTGLPRVSADPNQLHQVFFNIILNAIQAMPHGGTLTIDARIVSGPDGRPRMEVNFQDTGVGIPEEHLARIFDPFFTNRRSGSMGTGLGLSVSQSMVRGMDGEILVESEVGHGTVMTVNLPIVERRRRPRVGETPKTRILFADDEPTIRRTISTFLSRRGYHVVSARDGLEALGILEDPEADFGLALIDVVMPRMGGVDLIRRIRKLRPDLPVVVLTGVAGSEDIDEVKALGVRRVFGKPADFDELLKTVETLAGPAEIPVMAETSKPER